MRILRTSVQDMGGGVFELHLSVNINDADSFGDATDEPIGSGPAQTGSVPDRIVHALIKAPGHTLTLSELHDIVGGNTGTINRQAWTLATNAPDLQIRLRGWVCSPERGRYSLTEKAIRVLGN